MDPALSRANKGWLAKGSGHSSSRPAFLLTLARPLFALPCAQPVSSGGKWLLRWKPPMPSLAGNHTRRGPAPLPAAQGHASSTISAAAKPRTLKLAKPGFRLGHFLSHPLLPFPGQAHSIDQLVKRRVSTHISNNMFIRSCAGPTFRSSGQQPYKIVQARLLAPFTRMSSRRPRITASGLLLLQIFPFLALLLRLRQKHLRLRKSLRPSNRSRAFPARRRDVRRRLLRGSKGLHAAARTHVLLRQLMLLQLMRT